MDGIIRAIFLALITVAAKIVMEKIMHMWQEGLLILRREIF